MSRCRDPSTKSGKWGPSSNFLPCKKLSVCSVNGYQHNGDSKNRIGKKENLADKIIASPSGIVERGL